MVLLEIQDCEVAILIGLMLGIGEMGIVGFFMESNRTFGEIEVFFQILADYVLFAICRSIINYAADKRERCLLHCKTIQCINYVPGLVKSPTYTAYLKLGVIHNFNYFLNLLKIDWSIAITSVYSEDFVTLDKIMYNPTPNNTCKGKTIQYEIGIYFKKYTHTAITPAIKNECAMSLICIQDL